MCGRCACSLDPAGIQRACAYRRNSDPTSVVKPLWLALNDQKYFPSYNISPQSNTPVLISGQQHHVMKALSGHSLTPDAHECNERVVQVMKWGLVPSWYKGEDAKSFSVLLNNCRYDGMFDKPSFKGAITKRQRCVVLAEGFYEWKRNGGKAKQPYYIYWMDGRPSNEAFELASMEDEKDRSSSINRLLTLAGLFDIWSPHDWRIDGSSSSSGQALYTYTVITVNATEEFGTIHDRMPAVLESESAINQWLDPSIPTSQAIKCINPHGSDTLAWHPVSSLVNNVRNKSSECVSKIELNASVNKKNSLHRWFKPSPKKSESSLKLTDCQEPLSKKPKFED